MAEIRWLLRLTLIPSTTENSDAEFAPSSIPSSTKHWDITQLLALLYFLNLLLLLSCFHLAHGFSDLEFLLWICTCACAHIHGEAHVCKYSMLRHVVHLFYGQGLSLAWN